MAKDKVGTVIKPLEAGGTYTKNMFTTPLGDKYARAFHEVYHASLQDREEKMSKLYHDAMADDTLTKEQKHIISECYVGFAQAICKDTVSAPIIAFVHKMKPVLAKAIKTQRKKGNRVVKTNRLKRTVNDLYDAVERTGFFFEVAYLPSLLKVFQAQFIQENPINKISSETDLTFETLVLAAFSKFGRACSPYSYANLWYITYFMQNISLLTYISKEVYDSIPGLKDQIRNIVKTINIIQVLEMKRAGIIADEKKDLSSDTTTTETSVIAPEQTYTTAQEVEVSDRPLVNTERVAPATAEELQDQGYDVTEVEV